MHLETEEPFFGNAAANLLSAGVSGGGFTAAFTGLLSAGLSGTAEAIVAIANVLADAITQSAPLFIGKASAQAIREAENFDYSKAVSTVGARVHGLDDQLKKLVSRRLECETSYRGWLNTRATLVALHRAASEALARAR